MTAPAEEVWDVAGSGAAPGRPKGRCVGDRVTIEAPRELVWDFVTDLAGWRAWNPLYGHMEGVAHEGAQIRFAVHLAGMKPQKSRARVRSVRQNEVLEYAVVSLGGLVKAFRFIELEELSPTRCRVVNGEIMGGPLGGLVARVVGDKVAQGLAAMNDALKTVAERKWRERPR